MIKNGLIKRGSAQKPRQSLLLSCFRLTLGAIEKLSTMARRCQVSGKQTGSGNTVSHSHRKSRRKFKVNLVTKKVYIADENRYVTLRISARMLKTLNRIGVKSLMRKYGQDIKVLAR